MPRASPRGWQSAITRRCKTSRSKICSASSRPRAPSFSTDRSFKPKRSRFSAAASPNLRVKALYRGDIPRNDKQGDLVCDRAKDRRRSYNAGDAFIGQRVDLKRAAAALSELPVTKVLSAISPSKPGAAAEHPTRAGVAPGLAPGAMQRPTIGCVLVRRQIRPAQKLPSHVLPGASCSACFVITKRTETTSFTNDPRFS